MFRLVVPLLCGALWWGAGGAAAAQPVKGGHYVFFRTLGSDVLGGGHYYVGVELTLANDGHELARPSFVGENVPCGKTNGVVDGIELSGSGSCFAPWRSGPTAASRRASRPHDLLDLRERTFCRRREGRGGHRGHPRAQSFMSAVPAGLPCAAARPTQRAARGTPLGCDRVTIREVARLGGQDEAYRVYDRGIGCTAARELARRWRASPACQRLAPRRHLPEPRRQCRAVVGGPFNGLASARCTARASPNGLAEFVHYQPCAPPNSSDAAADITMWAVNVGCATATAFPVDTLVGDAERATGPCGDIYSLPFTSAPAHTRGGLRMPGAQRGLWTGGWLLRRVRPAARRLPRARSL